MNEKELAPHVKEVKRALTMDLSDKEVEEELLRYVEEFGVPIGQAKRSMVSKYGGEVDKLRSTTKKEIQHIIGDERSLDLTARVLASSKRNITARGEEKEIITGILGDNSGTIPFTSWVSSHEIKKGDTLEVKNAYAKIYREEPQINFGDRTAVKQADEDALPPYEPEAMEKEIKDIRIGDRNLTVKVKILDVEGRKIQLSDGGEKMLYTGTVADETGKVPFAAWHDFGLKNDQGITIENCYVKRWSGSPQVVFDENSTVKRLDEEAAPEVDDSLDEPTPIDQIASMEGGFDMVVRGIVVDIRDGTGLIFRCPECNRVLRNGECKLHGEVDGEPDLRVKGVIDDGKGALTFFLNRESTEEILGKTLDDALEVERKRPGQDKTKKELEKKLITKTLTLRGNVSSEDYGLMMIVKSSRKTTPDLEKDARKVMNEMEAYA